MLGAGWQCRHLPAIDRGVDRTGGGEDGGQRLTNVQRTSLKRGRTPFGDGVLKEKEAEPARQHCFSHSISSAHHPITDRRVRPLSPQKRTWQHYF